MGISRADTSLEWQSKVDNIGKIKGFGKGAATASKYVCSVALRPAAHEMTRLLDVSGSN